MNLVLISQQVPRPLPWHTRSPLVGLHIGRLTEERGLTRVGVNLNWQLTGMHPE